MKGISCRNFRCFGERTTVPVAPLTVLVGPNNAGKSSVIDLMRLLARERATEDGSSASFKDERFELDFRSGDHRLSSFEKLLTTGQKTLEIGTQFDLSSSRSSGIQLTNSVSIHRRYRKHRGVPRLQEIEGFLLPATGNRGPVKADERDRRKLFQIEYEYRYTETSDPPSHPVPVPEHWKVGYNFETGGVRIEHIEEHEKEPAQSESASKDSTVKEDSSSKTEGFYPEVYYQGVLEPPLIEIALAYANALRTRKGEPRFDVTPQTARLEADYGHISRLFGPKFFDSSFISALELPEGWPPDYEDDLWKFLKEKILSPLADQIHEASRFTTTYAPSYRASGQAYYGPSDSLTRLLKSFDEGRNSSRKKVNTWIEKLDLGRDLQVERIGPSLYEATIEQNGERRSLAECGSGVSQLLPLILQFTVGKTGSVLLVEEPEANLHPDLQARLADLFGELAKVGKMMVETHSEYFIRRIQYLVARGDIDPDLVQILYVEPPSEESSSQIRPISVDEKGQLSKPFGPGFFDQATDLMVDLFKYGSEN
nr:DUF3696 domain-containing protein [Salinibacter ruber]